MQEYGQSGGSGSLTDDALAGPFRVWQRARGHRFSLDDMVTAKVAAQACPEATVAVDLGCGLGSVLLMLAYKLDGARLWGVEAQAESFALLTRNCERNGFGAGGRVRVAHADLRDPGWIAQVRAELPGAGAALVTGTPPYQPLGRGTVSPDPQRAHARVELRGGVEAYLATAAQLLAPDGRMVVCADARTPERVQRSAAGVGLALVSRMSVVPADGKGALFDVWTLARGEGGRSAACVTEPPFVARDAEGRRTETSLELLRFFGRAVPAAEPASPRVRSRRQ